MMQGDLFNDSDHDELANEAADLGHTGFQSEEPETSELESTSSFRTESDLSLIHISEPTRPRLISYAVFCLKKKN